MNIITPSAAFDLPHGVPPRGGGLELRTLLMMLRRRLRVIIGVFVLVASGVTAYTLLQRPLYTATATVMVNPRQERVLSEEQAMAGGAAATQAVVDSELEVLRSRDLAQRLATAAKLNEDPEWNTSLRPGVVSHWVRSVRDTIAGRRTPAGEQDVVDKVAEAIDVRRRGLSYAIDVSVTAESAARAAALTNQAIELYVVLGHDLRAQSATRARGWLQSRVEELRRDVQVREAAAQAYRAQSGLLTSDGVPLTESQISDVQAAVLEARATLAEIEARFQQVQAMVRAGGSADTIAAALNSEVIRDLRQREADLLRRQAEYENTLGELHPTLQNNRAELENVRQQIGLEIRRIQNNLSNEVQVAQARLATLEASLRAVRGELVGNNSALVRLNELEREASASRGVYESFLQRYHEVADQGRLDANDIRIVTRAMAPTAPSSPDLVLHALAAVAMGLGLGLGFALMLERLDDGVKSAADIERQVGAQAIASVPLVSAKALRLLEPTERHPSGLIVDKPMSAFAESLRVLRTAIRFGAPERRGRLIAITSAIPGEGKTTIALSLARLSAISGGRVLLIDCDVRRRALNELLAIDPRAGIVQVLLGERSWRDVVGRDEYGGAHVLPAAAAAFTPRDLFDGEPMRQLISELRDAYDLIILDCAPVLAIAEARVVATQADCVVLVARWARTPAREIGEAIAQLENAGARVLGAAINMVDPRAAGRGYGGPFYYGTDDRYYAN